MNRAVSEIRQANERMDYSHVRNLMIFRLDGDRLVPDGGMVEDLYPDVIEWCRQQQQEAVFNVTDDS